jgi:hypothetical protein
MPSMVSSDRMRLASMPRRATRMLSIVMRDLTPRLVIDRCCDDENGGSPADRHPTSSWH